MKLAAQLVSICVALAIGTLASLYLHPVEAQAPDAAPPSTEQIEPHIELAPYMTRIQTFSQKLGYSIAGRNQPLAQFYLYEMREAVSEIVRDIPVYDNLPIDQLMVTMFYPPLKPLDTALAASDWPAADAGYTTLINACNTCHTASLHPFIQITPASGTPPFNQKFTPN